MAAVEQAGHAERPGAGEQPWWRHAVTYQVYVRSFADSNGDGVGDLPGITARLPHLRDLGVDAVWLTPFYTSPQHDHGYDVADYTDVDPLFGTLQDADALIARAHELGLRVIVDLVPNHTSSEHPWFRAALAAGPGSPERTRYLFRDGRGPGGSEPPNNWRSVFGGPAWTRVPDGQWYLHLFDSTQPDLDWRRPEVGDMFEEVLRFWLDRGVDGFRIDVAHGLLKEASLRDQETPDSTGAAPEPDDHPHAMVERTLLDEPMWDQPEVHDVYRRWRRVLDEYDGDRMLVAEAWTQTPESMARFVRPDEMHQAFNFAWLLAPWSARAFADVIEGTLAAVESVGASATWVLSNHDVVRHRTRYGGGHEGLARARAATLTMLALPGSAYVYQGEELGLEQVDVAPEHRQDPAWLRSGPESGDPGRDGSRVPLPWEGAHPPYGFGPGTAELSWIPQPTTWHAHTVAAQDDDPASTLAFYREALRVRRSFATSAGERVSDLEVDGDVLRFRRGPVLVVLNCGSDVVPLPEGEVLVSSGALTELGGDETAGSALRRGLPPDRAVWIRVPEAR
ncbi:glycoside hydrolase family 13 protein [Nocardioides sp. zg-DK7169]|uniref:glycoside hydrolase family 13 protein n=1 Tax=Nocardioides sp. zg-DK7169 TaxID=2736600 RepID=UPI001552ABCF|nr:glycoside hydrolase family 13 protein [Nocardioides sp. zg-DK7169]NPC98901.1 glycoside hydrolase family 13 protein [Nocardioides sp. zg-DK7169]